MGVVFRVSSGRGMIGAGIIRVGGLTMRLNDMAIIVEELLRKKAQRDARFATRIRELFAIRTKKSVIRGKKRSTPEPPRGMSVERQ